MGDGGSGGPGRELVTRDDLFAIATKHGWQRRKPLSKPQRAAIAAEIGAKLTQDEVERASRVWEASGGKAMTLSAAVNALLEEL